MKQTAAVKTLFVAFLALSLSIKALASTESEAFWVYLTEREFSTQNSEKILQDFDAKTIQRRMELHGSPLFESDYPAKSALINSIAECGAELRCYSRWLNAVSINANEESLSRIEDLPYVKKIEPVRRSRTIESFEKNCRTVADIDSCAYGVSYQQNKLLNVPEVHALGYTGLGVRIAFLDGGFDAYDSHNAFRYLNVVATYNAIDSSSFVETHCHGMNCMSVAVANDTNNFIGISPHAEVLLVRTEDTAEEYPAEEDYWVAGLEWAEANGADIVSSSLSYCDWYEYSDMDGNTAVVTVAADMAAERGLLVINSAGNTGRNGPGTITAPGDGDSVLTVGATDSAGVWAEFSSQGPTYDGRIKPNVCAQGVRTFVAFEEDSSSYVQRGGTSFSCPAIAGVAALMLQVQPNLTPVQIIELMQDNSSCSENPDNRYGYGIVDALSVVNSLLNSGSSEKELVPNNYLSTFVFPNPTNAKLSMIVSSDLSGVASLTIYDIMGRRVKEKKITVVKGENSFSIALEKLPSGSYYFTTKMGTEVHTGRFNLLK